MSMSVCLSVCLSVFPSVCFYWFCILCSVIFYLLILCTHLDDRLRWAYLLLLITWHCALLKASQCSYTGTSIPDTKFPEINFLQTALFMFKVDRNLLPSHLIKSFHQNSEIHHYCTRSSDKISPRIGKHQHKTIQY